MYIEPALEYFLVPLKDQESLFFVGDRQKMDKVLEVMDEKDIAATTGVNGDRCYVLVAYDNDKCTSVIEEAENERKSS